MFEPHPREFFQPDKPHFRLTPLPRKLALLEALGLDVAVVVRFDAALAGLTAEAFIERVLVQGLGVRHVVVGYDFRFGKGRAGDPETLRRAGAAHGFGVTVVAQVAEAGEVFSSSAVRAELAQGDVEGAAEHARPLVARGRHGGRRRQARHRPRLPDGQPDAADRAPRWRMASTPCASIATAGGSMAPPISAPARRSTTARRCWRCSCSISTAICTAAQIEVEFIGFVRADAKFASAAALQEQMARDVERAREILAAAPAAPGRGRLKGRRDAAASPAAGVAVACHPHSWRHPLRAT